MSFAANLRRLRINANLTQEQLAHACGYSGQSRIGNYEKEGIKGREPPLSDIPVIARALGVEIAQLFGETGSGRGSHSARLDPERIAELATVLAERAGVKRNDLMRWDLRDEVTAARFVEAYAAYVAMKESPTPENVVRFSLAVAESPQGAENNERSKDVPAQGTAKRHVGGGAGRKA